VKRLGSLLASEWLTVRVQIALGLFFVVAALPKVADPPAFAHMVYNYRILPGPLVNVLALVLPWFELLCGLALVLGIWRRTAAAWVGVLLVVFIAGISFNLARGNAVDCGCFDPKSSGKSVDERVLDMKMVVLRDVGMLLMVAQILHSSRVRAGTEHPRA